MAVGTLMASVISVIAGILMGQNMEKHRASLGLPPKPEKIKQVDTNICGCTHHRSFHDEDRKVAYRDESKRRVCRVRDSYGQLMCGCQQFIPQHPTVVKEIRPISMLDEIREELDGL
jgi:hypothetical protein